MQIKVSTRHGHLSDAHKQEITARAGHLLHYFDRITMIEVTIDLGKNGHKACEIKVDAEHKHDFVAIDEADELMVAVEGAMKKMEHQIHRYKEKIQDHRRDPATGVGPDGGD